MEEDEELQPTPSAPCERQGRGNTAVTFSPRERPTSPPLSSLMISGVSSSRHAQDPRNEPMEEGCEGGNHKTAVPVTLWPLALLNALRRTSPLSSLHNLATSFSVVNDFVFLPPSPPRYRAEFAGLNGEDAYECAVRAGRDVDIRRWHIPWEHRCTVRSTTVGSPPFFGHGGAPIPVALLTARKQNDQSGASVERDETEHGGLQASEEARKRDSGGAGHPRLFGSSDDASVGAAVPLLLYFHGNGGDCASESLACASEILLAFSRPCRMLLVEYPGYGPSIGDPSEAYCKACAERVLQFLFSNPFTHCTPYDVVLTAHSIGTGVAVHCLQILLEAFHSVRPTVGLSSVTWERCRWVRGVVLLAPFSSLVAVVNPNDDISVVYGSSAAGLEFEARIRQRVEAGSRSGGGGAPIAGLMPVARMYRDWVAAQRLEGPIQGRTTAGVVKQTGPRLNAVYRLGSQWMWNRFESCKVVRQLQERYGVFHHTPLVVAHGNLDAIIPVEHSVRLCAAAAAVSAACSDESPLHVYAHLTHTYDHNTIFEACEELRFREAVRRVMQAPTNTAPAVAVPPVVVEEGVDPLWMHLTRHALSSSTAVECYRLHEEHLARIRAAVVGCLVVAAGWVLVVGPWYVVHFRADVAPDNGRVVAWSVLEGIAIAGIASLTVWAFYYRKFVAREWTLGELAFYAVARIVVYGLVLSCGIVLGLACALSRSVCPHLVAGSGSDGSASPKSAICSVVRWTMVVAAVSHILHFVWTIFRNH